MKHNLSLKTMCALAVVVLMTSCVAKRKYTEAQNTITQLQTENAQLRETGTTMQTSLTSLEARNRSLQSQLDSTNSWASGQQTRWSSFQAFYDEGMKTTEQVHQQLHQQLDNMLGAENITTSGGRIYVTLPEKTLFTSGSSKLTSKGAEVLTSLAQVVKDNPNVDIDISSTPNYYAGNTSMSGNGTMNNSSSMGNQSQLNNQNNTSGTTGTTGTTGNNNNSSVTNNSSMNNTSMDNNTTGTRNSTAAKKSGTRSNSYSGTAKSKSTGYKSTARKSESKSRTYSSSPVRKTSASSTSTWSLNMSRSSSIAKKLVDEGVSKSRILVSNAEGNGGTSTKKDFQVIISPKPDKYYDGLGNGSMNNMNNQNQQNQNKNNQ